MLTYQSLIIAIAFIIMDVFLVAVCAITITSEERCANASSYSVEFSPVTPPRETPSLVLLNVADSVVFLSKNSFVFFQLYQPPEHRKVFPTIKGY